MKENVRKEAMPDPTTHAAAITAVTAPVIAAATTAAGIALWPFGISFAFGTIALVYLDRMLLRDAVLSVLASTAIGGTVAQLTAYPVLLVAAGMFPALQPWAIGGQLPMTAAIALAVGLFCQRAMPALLRRTDKLGGPNA
jgi:hypothetical protein